MIIKLRAREKLLVSQKTLLKILIPQYSRSKKNVLSELHTKRLIKVSETSEMKERTLATNNFEGSRKAWLNKLL